MFSLQNPQILDAGDDLKQTMIKIAPLLKNLRERVNELENTSKDYIGYQKSFKVEVTKFDELSEVHGEILLKQLLWDSLANWDVALGKWMEVCYFIYH